MATRRKKGFFIVFEGGDGTGKSTQIKRLRTSLLRRGLKVVATREPGGTELGREVRKTVLKPRNAEVSPIAELLLYVADRNQDVFEVIRPALEKGKVVISDRFADSTEVYQGMLRGLGKVASQLNKIAIGTTQPDLVLLLDLPVSEGLRRVGGRGKKDRLERETRAFHERVRRGFLKLARRFPKRYVVIDATQSVGEVEQAINRAVFSRLERRGLCKPLKK